MKTPSPTAKLLGFAGLIPFIALSVFQLLFPSSPHKEMVMLSLTAYGATIVSFLGAIHWGLAMQQDLSHRYLLVWGVIPSLLGWLSLLLDPINGWLLLVATLWLCFLVDYKIYPTFQLTSWLPMRFTLTSVASMSIGFSLIFF